MADMTDKTRCSGLVNGVCIHGFVPVPACRFGGIGLTGYSQTQCTNEEWAARLWPETGQPSADEVARAHARAGI